MTNGSMQADAFLFQTAGRAGRHRGRRGADLRPHAAGAAQARRRDPGDPAAGGRDRRRRARAARWRRARGRSSRTSSPTSRTRPAARCRSRSAARLLALAAEYDFVIFEDDPYVALRFEGEPLPTMLSLDEGEQRRLRVVVLEDGLPRHPRRLPGRPGRADRPDPQAATNTYISPNMVAQSIVNEFCRSGAIDELDRDGQGRARASGATRSRGARARSSRTRASSARGRLLPLGRPARRHRRGRAGRRPPRSAAWCSSRAPTSCSRAARARCGSPTPACTPDQIDEGRRALAEAYRELAGAAA